MIIAMASSKGGVGKSTLAAHIADEWHRRGLRVLVVDADPQGSMLDWAAENEQGPTVVGMGDNLRAQVRTIANGFDRVIIDTPGRQSKRLAAAVGIADLALIPCGSGTTDLWAANQTIDTVSEAQELRGGPPVARIVLNRVTLRTVMGRNAAPALEESGVPLLTSALGDRVAFVEAMACGMGATQYDPKSIAAREVSALVDELDALTEEVAHVA